MSDDIMTKRRQHAAQIARIIRNGDICGTCYSIPEDCTCPGKTLDTAADPLHGPSWWEQREDLHALYEYARLQGASPAAMLTAALMLTLAQTPSGVHLPGLRGGKRGSLNLFGALVGKSGAGKGAATDAAEDGIVFQNAGHFVIGQGGSGEGLVGKLGHLEIDKDTKERRLIRDADSVLLDVTEIAGLGAQMGRAGSTLTEQLLKAYSGGRLGFGYAGSNGVEIEKHSYRLAMIAGVQPENAGILLEHEGSGLPQRFVWSMATAPDAPDFDPDALEAPPVRVSLPSWAPGDHTVTMDRPVLLEIGQNARELARDSGLGLDGHAMFTREKVAAALAFMRGAKHITVEDWELSAGVMGHSDYARAYCQRVIAAKHKKEQRRAGEARDEIAAAADARREERIRKNLMDAWTRRPDATASALVKSLASRDRRDGYDIAEKLAMEYPTFPRVAQSA